MKANMNYGEFSVPETQIVDWRSGWTPVSSAASCLMSSSQLIWPTCLPAVLQDPSLRVNSSTSLHRGRICCFMKATSGCKSCAASRDLTWESARYLPAPSAGPPLALFNSQSEEIRAKCDYLMTLETISSKLKEHKRLLYLTLIPRQRSHNVFTCGEDTNDTHAYFSHHFCHILCLILYEC